MYCRFCGKKIENDSDFCRYCGKRLSQDENGPTEPKETNPINSDEKEATEEEKNSGWGCWVLSILMLFFIVVIIVLIVRLANDGRGYRDLNSGDYTCKTSQGLMSYSVTIIPDTDIEECNVLLILYDRNDKEIYSDTITKTDLEEDGHYTFNFDFGFLNALSGYAVRYYITGRV